MKKIKQATFKHIESELRFYHDTLKEIQTLRTDIMYCKESTDENIGGGRGSQISDPTAQIGTRLTTHKRLQQLEDIANAIGRVYTGLPEEHQKLVKLYYWTNPRIKTWDGIAQELHISRRQAIRWRDEIVHAVNELLGWR